MNIGAECERILNGMTLKTRTQRKKGVQALSEADKERICEWYDPDNGVFMHTIGERLDIHEGTVSRVLRDAGITSEKR